MGENTKVFLLAAIVAVGVFLIGIIGGAMEYALNASILDSIDPSKIQWWHFFTFDQFMAYQFAHNLGIFIGIYLMIAGVVFIAFIIFWYYKG